MMDDVYEGDTFGLGEIIGVLLLGLGFGLMVLEVFGLYRLGDAIGAFRE